jgi:hypothetical protein
MGPTLILISLVIILFNPIFSPMLDEFILGTVELLEKLLLSGPQALLWI